MNESNDERGHGSADHAAADRLALYRGDAAGRRGARLFRRGRARRPAELEPFARVGFACESLKVTTRIMHIVAWLLTQKAVETAKSIGRRTPPGTAPRPCQ